MNTSDVFSTVAATATELGNEPDTALNAQSIPIAHALVASDTFTIAAFRTFPTQQRSAYTAPNPSIQQGRLHRLLSHYRIQATNGSGQLLHHVPGPKPKTHVAKRPMVYL